MAVPTCLLLLSLVVFGSKTGPQMEAMVGSWWMGVIFWTAMVLLFPFTLGVMALPIVMIITIVSLVRHRRAKLKAEERAQEVASRVQAERLRRAREETERAAEQKRRREQARQKKQRRENRRRKAERERFEREEEERTREEARRAKENSKSSRSEGNRRGPGGQSQNRYGPTQPNVRSAHEVLGVVSNASEDEIVAAYRKLAQMYHPDRVSGLGPEFSELAERRMKEINAAYAQLRPQRKR